MNVLFQSTMNVLWPHSNWSQTEQGGAKNSQWANPLGKKNSPAVQRQKQQQQKQNTTVPSAFGIRYRNIAIRVAYSYTYNKLCMCEEMSLLLIMGMVRRVRYITSLSYNLIKYSKFINYSKLVILTKTTANERQCYAVGR